ncbi:MAG: hypothetical protein V1818_02670 [Candidatus Aenigmatarchaeota archaeon]
MKKLFLSFLAITLVLSQVAFAQDFSMTIEPTDIVKHEFLATHTEYIKLTIENPLFESWFTVSVVGFPQEWVTAKESLIRVPAYSKGEVLIEVNLPKDALPNIYEYFLKVTRTNTGSVSERSLLINVKQVTSAILRDIYLSCGTCTDEVLISGNVYNVGSKLLNNLVIVANVGNQQKTFPIERLGVLESKEFTMAFDLDGKSPGSYDVDFELVDDIGRIFYTEQKSFKIPSIENIVYDNDVSSTPFGSSVTLTATNTGNIDAEADLSSVSPEGWYYFYSGPNPTGMILGKYYWKTTIAPGESSSVTYSEIYWPTYVLIIAAVLAGVFIYWQSTALTFSKRLITKTDGHASVSLHLRSRKKGVDGVFVKDTVPSQFSIMSNFESVKPIIKKIADGVELHWRLGKMGSKEERVLHYTIKPAENMVGDVKLPAAKAKGKRHKAPIYKRSNRVSVRAGGKKRTFSVAVNE